MKKSIVILLLIVTIFASASCSQRNDILGKYVSESGKYTVEFKEDNICIWYQEILDTEIFFEGTYEKEGEKYKLLIRGEGVFTINTSFEAELTDQGLIITGGIVKGELFVKQ